MEVKASDNMSLFTFSIAPVSVQPVVVLPVTVTITVAIPALDRLMEFLESAQQQQIDAAAAALTHGTSKLKTAVDTNQPEHG